MNNHAFARQPDRAAPKRKRAHDYLMLLAYALLLVMAMLLVLSKQRNLYQFGYDVVELRTENSKLRESRDILSAELARLTAPDRVVQQAVAQGLRFMPETSRFEVRIQDEATDPAASAGTMVAMLEETL